MADNQRVIEILLQFKQANAELVAQATAAISGMGTAGTKAAETATAALPAVGAAGVKAGKEMAAGLKDGAEAGTKSLKDKLKEIKGEFGKGSTFGTLIKTMMGGGAIYGIGLITKELKALADNIAEAANGVRRGTLTIEEAFSDFIRKIPVFGTMVGFFDSLIDAYTGASVEAEKSAHAIDLQIKKMEESQKKIKAIRKEMKEALAYGQEAARSAIDATVMAGTPDNEKEALRIEQERIKALGDIDKRVNEARAKMQSGFDMWQNALKTGSGEDARRLQNDYAVAYEAYAKIFKNLSIDKDAVKAKYDAEAAALAGKQYEESAKALTDKVGTIKKSWNDLFDAITDNAQKWSEDMKKEADKVRQDVATPQENAAADRGRMGDLKRRGFIDQDTYTRALAAIDAKEKELFDAGIERIRQKEEAQEKAALAQENMLLDDARKYDAMAVAQAEYQAQTLGGIQRSEAEAKAAYARDVANWNDALRRKAMDLETFNALVVQRQKELDEQLQQMQYQKAQANREAGMLHSTAGGDTKGAALAAIDMQAAEQLERWRQYYAQGLIDERTYEQTRQDIAKESTDKQLEITGSFLEGMKLGFEQLNQAALTAAQIGIRVAGQLADGFGNAFSEMVMGTKSAAEAFRDMAVSILSDLSKLFAKMAFINVMKSLFAGTSFGGLLGANAGGMVGGMGGVPAFAGGGFVGGSGPDRDSVPAMLTPGEFVVRRRAVEQPGMAGLLERINSGMAVLHRATGGYVAPESAPLAGMGGAGGGQVIEALVNIGDREIARISANPKFKAAVRMEVARNKDTILGGR